MRVAAPVGSAVLEEGVAALLGLRRHVRHARRLPREDLLARHSVVGEVEGELQHADRLRGLGGDRRGPFERRLLEMRMGDRGVDHPPAFSRFGVVAVREEEDLARPLVPDLAGEEGRTVAGVEGADVRVGLHEGRVLLRGDRQVADHVERVPAARRPTGNRRDDDLRHLPDQALDFEDVEASGARGVDLLAPGRSVGLRVGALDLITVAVGAAHPLVAARAEGIAAVLRARAVAGEDDGRHVARLARVIEAAVQLVDGRRSEGVADVGPVEGDAHDRHVLARGAAVGLRSARDSAVVREVVEVEARDFAPPARIEGVGDEGKRAHGTSLRKESLLLRRMAFIRLPGSRALNALVTEGTVGRPGPSRSAPARTETPAGPGSLRA